MNMLEHKAKNEINMATPETEALTLNGFDWVELLTDIMVQIDLLNHMICFQWLNKS